MKNAVDRYMAADDDEAIAEISATIESGDAKFLDLVELLGNYLTRDEGAIRSRAIACLAGVLAQLPPKKLPSQQVAVICGFLCDRIEDEDSLRPVMEGLKAVVEMVSFDAKTGVTEILSALSDHVNMRKHSQTTRYAVYQLLESIVARHGEFLVASQPQSHSFIITYVKLTTGEKDPRNLLISFGISANILKLFTIDPQKDSELVEDLFDVTFCYFPITFEPPKNDPYGITSADLKQALRKSLAQNSIFAPEAFPRLIEKLNSGSQSVKVDTLDTITACIVSFDHGAVEKFWVEIYDAVKFEILHGSEEGDSLVAAENTIKALSAKLVMDQTNAHAVHGVDGETPLDQFLAKVKTEGGEKLEKPDSKLAIPAARLVVAAAQGSETSFESLAQFVVDSMLRQLNDSPSTSVWGSILVILILTLKAGGSEGPENAFGAHVLHKYSEQLFDQFSKALMSTPATESTLKQTSIKGLSQLVSAKLVDDSETALIIQYLGVAVLKEESNVVVQDALALLVTLSRANVDQILTVTFPEFLAQLPDTNTDKPGVDVSRSGGKSIDFVLSSLAAISVYKPIFETLVIRLLNKFRQITLSSGQNESNWNSSGYRYPLAILSTFVAVISDLDHQGEDISGYFDKLVQPLFTLAAKASAKDLILHDVVVDSIAKLAILVVRRLDESKQLQVVKDLFGFFAPSEQAETHNALFGVAPEWALFGSPEYLRLSPLFASSLAPISKAIELPVGADEFCDNLTSVLAEVRPVVARIAGLRLLTIVVNKWVKNSEHITTRVRGDLESAATRHADSIGDAAAVLSNIESAVYITKALLMKGDSNANPLVDALLDLLPSQSVGLQVARAIGLLVGDDEIVTKRNGAIVRLLYKQKLFMTVLPSLTGGFKAASGDDTRVRVNYLTALAGIVRFLPSKIVIPEIPKFLSLLMESITLPDPRVQQAAIDTILATQVESADTIARHVDTIIPKLLTATASNSSSVRGAALKCLGALPSNIPSVTLEPFRTQIVRKLGESLDDPKRAVRREAVICRQRYYEM